MADFFNSMMRAGGPGHGMNLYEDEDDEFDDEDEGEEFNCIDNDDE